MDALDILDGRPRRRRIGCEVDIVTLVLGWAATLAAVVAVLFRLLNEANARNYTAMVDQFQARLQERDARIRDLREDNQWLRHNLNRGADVVVDAVALAKERTP